jgi:putative ABC transport system ATP-binding protein
MNILELKDVEKIYQTGKLLTPALLDINLLVKSGEMVAIMGPSGSGKSTLMNIIGLLDRPSNGEVKIGGELIDLSMSDAKLAKLRGKKIGFVFQSFNLLPKLSALANVLLPTSYQKENKNDARKKALALLTQVGLKERTHHKPNELSGGEKQRVAIARALVNDPDIILADEPTGNLDSKSGQEVITLLKELNEKGKTVVIITHDLEIGKQCERIIRLKDGRVVEGGQHV